MPCSNCGSENPGDRKFCSECGIGLPRTCPRSVVSKRRISKTGLESGGHSFSRVALYALLSNPIYVGEIRHKNLRHPGQHQAIVDRVAWE